MIRFLSDWDDYPSAIPDWTTKNEWFLRYVAVLQKMGVKNHHWPLALLNPELQGVDPFDPNLTQDQMGAIKIEAEFNPWYYFRECLRIPPASGNVATEFRANRANMSMLWSYMCHIDYLLIQPRQTGKSISSYALYSWLLYMRYRNARISLVTKSAELRSETSGKIRQIREYLPEYLTVYDKSDTIIDEKITYNTRGNYMSIAVSRSDKSGANKVGRGNTSPTVGWDESPFINFIEIAFKAAMPGMNEAIKSAKANGMPWGSLLTTTAGDQTSRDGKFIHTMWSEATRWSEHFMDVSGEEELLAIVKANSNGRKVLIAGTWSHNQVGVTDEEHYANMARASASGPEADRDFFNIWTADSTKNPYDKELLGQAVNSQRYSDYSEHFKGGFIVHWFLPQEELEARAATLEMVIGADTSEGVGRDSLSLVFVDPYDLSVLGVSVVNAVLIPKYAEFLAEVLMKYQKALFNPERKSTGQTFIDYLCIILHSKGIDPFKRIFNSIVQDWDLNRPEFQEINGDIQRRDDPFYIRRKNKFGFGTNTTTRKTLYEIVMLIALRKGASRMHDQQLISEVTGLVDKNGRVDHEEGKHDDMVIAWLLAIYPLVYGNRLEHYGLDPRRVLTRAFDGGKPKEAMDEEEEDIFDLQQQIESNLERLKKSDTPTLSMKLEKRIRFLLESLESYGIDTVNIAGKIDDINNERMDAFQKYVSQDYYR